MKNHFLPFSNHRSLRLVRSPRRSSREKFRELEF